MRRGRATPEGTARFRQRFAGRTAAGHFRSASGLWLSSIGVGTYLGADDAATDAAYEEAVLAALAAGVNVFDSAANYRSGRSERCVGRALERAFATGVAARDEVFVSTKGGFPAGGGPHCLEPSFLAGELEKSRASLGLETIDLYYLHNPETELSSRSKDAALESIRRALTWGGGARDEGRVAAVGIATWNGLRRPPGASEHLPLTGLISPDRESPALTAIQLPLNLAMPEALAAPTQELDEATLPALVVARYAGLSTFASASILQGRLAAGLPAEIAEVFAGLETDAQRALQFTRSAPGVTTALVGMSSPEHVRENLELVRHEPAAAEELQRLFAGGVS